MELYKLNEWFCANKLSLNVSKCKYMLFGHKRKRQIDIGSAFISMSGITLDRFISRRESL